MLFWEEWGMMRLQAYTSQPAFFCLQKPRSKCCAVSQRERGLLAVLIFLGSPCAGWPALAGFAPHLPMSFTSNFGDDSLKKGDKQDMFGCWLEEEDGRRGTDRRVLWGAYRLGQMGWKGAQAVASPRPLPNPCSGLCSCWVWILLAFFQLLPENSLCFFRKTSSPPLFHFFRIIVFYNTGIWNSCDLTARCGNWFPFFSAPQADCKPVPGCYYSPSRQFSRHEGKECSSLWGQCFDSWVQLHFISPVLLAEIALLYFKRFYRKTVCSVVLKCTLWWCAVC